MKKLLLIFLCVPLLFSCGEKKENTKENQGIDIPEKKDRNSLLWKIEKEDKVSYLFGTTHVMCKDDMVYTDLLEDLVEEVDVIVTESDDAETPEGGDIQYGKGILGIDIPDEYKLRYMYSEYELRELFYFLSDLGYDEDFIDFILETDIISASLYMIESCLRDCELSGSEIYIESILDDKEELYLEDLSDIIPVFSKWIHYTYQNIDPSMTGYSIEDLIESHYEECSEEKLLREQDNYKNNDPKADWEDMMDIETEVDNVLVKGMVKYLLKERNRIWIPRMIDIMDDDKSLFAVGALHVLDLVERLEKEGYRLTPLDIK